MTPSELRRRALKDLVDAYAVERYQRDADHPILSPMAPGPCNTYCRYCKRKWFRVVDSPWDGHTRCVVSADFMRALAKVMTAAKLDTRHVAPAFGVHGQVIRSWLDYAEENPT